MVFSVFVHPQIVILSSQQQQIMKPVRLVRSHRNLSNQPNGSHHHTSLARSPLLECSHQKYSTGFDQMSTYKWSNYATCGSLGGPYFATIYIYIIELFKRMMVLGCFRSLLIASAHASAFFWTPFCGEDLAMAMSAVCAHAYKKTTRMHVNKPKYKGPHAAGVSLLGLLTDHGTMQRLAV